MASCSVFQSGDRSFAFARKPGADTQLRWDEIDPAMLDETHVFHFGSLSCTDEPARSATQSAVAYARAHGKLNNAGFIAKAPAELVEREREKLATNEGLLEKLKSRIAEMEALR